jgi:hypothetical protein
MKIPDTTPVRLTAVGMALICVLAGCGKSDEKPSSSSSAAAASTSGKETTKAAAEPAAASDYSTLLMAADDIDAPEPFIAEPPIVNPNGMNGVAGLYHTAGDTAMIGDTVIILADPAEAANVLTKTAEQLGTSSVVGTPAPSSVGANGSVVAGTSPDGTKAVTVLLFTEENAFVTLQFESPPGDLNPVPPDFVDSVGQLQLEALKAGLPAIAPPAPLGAGTPPPATVTVDGKPFNVQGQVVCATNDGKYSIAIGDMATGIIVGLEPDASVVHGVGLGTVDGVVMSFTEGVPGNTATATKDGNTYKVTGTATGVSEAKPTAEISKPFEVSVTCP